MNSSTPLISIIIPVYNTEKYLSRCIDSVLAQSYSNFELILVDDGSQDLSGKICDDYATQDSRVKVLHQENQGVSIARNNGMSASQGEYISFIDSDDWVESDYLKAFVDVPSSQDIVELLIFDVLHHNLVENDVYCSGLGALTFSVAKFFKKSIININKIQFPSDIKTSEDTLFIATYLNHVDELKTIPHLVYHYETNLEGACERHKRDANTISFGLTEELKLLQSPNLSDLSKKFLQYNAAISFHHFVNALYKYPHSQSERILLLKEVLLSVSNAIYYYPNIYLTDKLVTYLLFHSHFLLGDILAKLSWKLRIRKNK